MPTWAGTWVFGMTETPQVANANTVARAFGLKLAGNL